MLQTPSPVRAFICLQQLWVKNNWAISGICRYFATIIQKKAVIGNKGRALFWREELALWEMRGCLKFHQEIGFWSCVIWCTQLQALLLMKTLPKTLCHAHLRSTSWIMNFLALIKKRPLCSTTIATVWTKVLMRPIVQTTPEVTSLLKILLNWMVTYQA